MKVTKESKILALFSRPLIIVPLLLFLIGISYANTLYSPFVLDDIHSFIEEPNVYMRDFSYESFSKLSSTFFGKARLIPIATFSINHYLAKGQMPIYHITNISIHLLATLVVYWFIATLLRTPVGVSALRGIPTAWFAFFAAALWALNPVQTNAVTYIVQRMTSISAFFYIAALAFYVKGRLAATVKSRYCFIWVLERWRCAPFFPRRTATCCLSPFSWWNGSFSRRTCCENHPPQTLVPLACHNFSDGCIVAFG